MKPAKATDIRKRELAQIHIAKAALGLAEDTYRDMLWTVARVRSASDLDWSGRKRVLEHLKACGWKNDIRRGAPRAPAAGKEPLIGKIGALLTVMGLPWGYANGISQQMFKVERVEWCTPAQLRKIVAALAYKAKKATSTGSHA